MRTMEGAVIVRRTIIDTLRPPEGVFSVVAQVLIGSLVVAALAQVSVAIGPVPISGQTLGVLLVAAALGSRRGAAAIAAYLAEGAAGLPVFAAGASGPAVIAGPTGGYLIGFLAAAFVVGRLCESGCGKRPSTAAVAMVAGNLVIYCFGVSWLSRFVGWQSVFQAGVIPFLPGDAIKIALAASLLPTAWRLAAPRWR